MTSSTLLAIQHEASSPPARLGDHLVKHGLTLDLRLAFEGDPVPSAATLPGYAGLLVLGGSMDSWDDQGFPWLPATRALVAAAEAAAVPTLGICLGHQLATLALGGEVGRNPSGTTLAVLPVGWTDAAAGDPVVGSLAATAVHGVHWNNDVALRLPAGATVLARSPDGAVQAARLGRHVWGLQYHPEADGPLVDDWVREVEASYLARGTDLTQYAEDAHRHAAALAAGVEGVADGFARLCRATPP